MQKDNLSVTLIDLYQSIQETNEQLKECAKYLKEFIQNVKEMREEEHTASK